MSDEQRWWCYVCTKHRAPNHDPDKAEGAAEGRAAVVADLRVVADRWARQAEGMRGFGRDSLTCSPGDFSASRASQLRGAASKIIVFDEESGDAWDVWRCSAVEGIVEGGGANDHKARIRADERRKTLMDLADTCYETLSDLPNPEDWDKVSDWLRSLAQDTGEPQGDG